MGVEMIMTPSFLLELAALDDMEGFKLAVENGKHQAEDVGFWYTRCIVSKKMSYEERTPLMVASQYGSVKVVEYLVKSGKCDVNRVVGSDRVTALHCAVAGGSESSSLIVQWLISASADVNLVDASGNRACDLIHTLAKVPTKNKQLDTLLKGEDSDSNQKKEYSVSELPDINNGVYGSDEFRMYCFKIKPCSRAYTHDWTECPFAHPGENARRRDPAKYNYTCVPCPEFKKGSCRKGEDCEFAHGVFESWLHPSQYKTRLCKDETRCARKVCFFAHRKEEVRPVYASTGSAVFDSNIGVLSPGGGGFVCTSTSPLSPSFAPLSPKSGASGGGGVMWQGKSGFGGTPPSLQLPGSRLRSSLSARDMEFERELIAIEHQFQLQHHHHHQQQVISRNLETTFNSINMARTMSMSPPRVMDSPKVVVAGMLNSRAPAFTMRSQSFIDRSSPMKPNISSPTTTNLSDWGSPDGKLDWGMPGDELNKLRKSNSFGFRGSNTNVTRANLPGFGEPDVSWVNTLVKDEANSGFIGTRLPNYGRGVGAGGGVGQGNRVRVQDMCSPWEQLYIEEELVV